MKPKRIFLFFNAEERLVWQVPWHDERPPCIIEARDNAVPDDGLIDDDAKASGTVH